MVKKFIKDEIENNAKGVLKKADGKHVENKNFVNNHTNKLNINNKTKSLDLKTSNSSSSKPMTVKSKISSLNLKASKDRKPKGILGKSESKEIDIDPNSALAKQFSNLELNRIKGIAHLLNITNTIEVLEYGNESQSNMRKFVDIILEESRNNDAISSGSSVLEEVVAKAKELNIKDINKKDNFFSKHLSFVQTQEERILEFEKQFDGICDHLDAASEELAEICDQLIYKIEMLNDMYDHNLDHFKEINIHIAAGELKLSEYRNNIIPKMEDDISNSHDMLASTKLTDIKRSLNSFEKKMHDLKLSRTSILQTAPQLRLIQDNNQMLVEKIHTTIMTVIPLWKKQFVMAMSLVDQQKANSATSALTNSASEFMKNNADMMNKTSVEIAMEMEKGDISLESLQYVQESLLSTIDETLKIKEDNEHKKQKTQEALNEIDMESIEKAEKEVVEVYSKHSKEYSLQRRGLL